MTVQSPANAAVSDVSKSPLHPSADLNRRHWEEVSGHHLQTDYYKFDFLLSGNITLSSIEVAELGSLSGLNGVHLQCGIGLDTLSLARLGACMVGIDYAESAIQVARDCAGKLHLDCHFDQGDVLNENTTRFEAFDFVYTSHGVLRWLSNLLPWARTIFNLLKPGGFFYIFEIHPLVYRLNSADETGVTLTGDYFEAKPEIKRIGSTHVGTLTGLQNDMLVHCDWPLSAIVNAILSVGLSLDFFNEHAATSYNRKGLIPRREANLWHLQSAHTPLPLAFSLRATKPGPDAVLRQLGAA